MNLSKIPNRQNNSKYATLTKAYNLWFLHNTVVQAATSCWHNFLVIKNFELNRIRINEAVKDDSMMRAVTNAVGSPRRVSTS